jgi:hypothetical protein
MGRIGDLRRGAASRSEPQRVNWGSHLAMSRSGEAPAPRPATIWLPIVVFFG